MHLSVVSTVMGVLITELLFRNGLALKLRKMEISELLFCISKTVKKVFIFTYNSYTVYLPSNICMEKIFL